MKWSWIIWIIAGIVILAWPDVIRWTIGIGAIVVGVLQLMQRSRDQIVLITNSLSSHGTITRSFWNIISYVQCLAPGVALFANPNILYPRVMRCWMGNTAAYRLFIGNLLLPSRRIMVYR